MYKYVVSYKILSSSNNEPRSLSDFTILFDFNDSSIIFGVLPFK